MIKLKGIIIKINIIILILFIIAIYYQYNNINNKDVALVIDKSEEASLNVSNPFYNQDNEVDDVKEEIESIITLVSNVKSDVADLNNWIWPTDSSYTLTSYYGYRNGQFHAGIDIYSYSGYGSNVYAANNGRVVATDLSCTTGYTSCNYGRGNYIVIAHNVSNYYTIYMHLSNIQVSVGDIVSGGDVIGNIGNTGNVIPVPTTSNPYGGTHLHFGTYVGDPLGNGTSFNPLALW